MVDINECLDMTLNLCDGNATCTDTDGSFDCSCKVGFTGDGRMCTGMCMVLVDTLQLDSFCPVDVNECDLSMPCDENALCTNTIGAFECSCNLGFTGNGSLCSGKWDAIY